MKRVNIWHNYIGVFISCPFQVYNHFPCISVPKQLRSNVSMTKSQVKYSKNYLNSSCRPPFSSLFVNRLGIVLLFLSGFQRYSVLFILDMKCFVYRNLESPDLTLYSVKGHKEIINSIDAVGGLGIGEGAPEIVTGSRDGNLIFHS